MLNPVAYTNITNKPSTTAIQVRQMNCICFEAERLHVKFSINSLYLKEGKYIISMNNAKGSKSHYGCCESFFFLSLEFSQTICNRGVEGLACTSSPRLHVIGAYTLAFVSCGSLCI